MKNKFRFESFGANSKNIMQSRFIFSWLLKFEKNLFIRLYFFVLHLFISFQNLAPFYNCSLLISKKYFWGNDIIALNSRHFYYLGYFSCLTSGSTAVGEITKFTSIFSDKINCRYCTYVYRCAEEQTETQGESTLPPSIYKINNFDACSIIDFLTLFLKFIGKMFEVNLFQTLFMAAILSRSNIMGQKPQKIMVMCKRYKAVMLLNMLP